MCGNDGCGCQCGFCPAGQVCEDGWCVLALPALAIVGLVPVDPGPPPADVTVELGGSGVEPGAGLTVQCFLNGQLDGTTTETSYLFEDLPGGVHSLCCQLVQQGEPLTNCKAAACVHVQITQACSGYGDPVCKDDNPCSLDACVVGGGDDWQCKYGADLANPDCCLSQFECDCEDGTWGKCVNNVCACPGC